MSTESTRNKLPVVADCFGCGVCCLHMGYPAYIVGDGDTPAEEHWLRLPDSLKQPLLEYISSYDAPREGELDGPCIWLDEGTRLCKHHEYRPNVCRDFKTGCGECLTWRDHYSHLIREK